MFVCIACSQANFAVGDHAPSATNADHASIMIAVSHGLVNRLSTVSCAATSESLKKSNGVVVFQLLASGAANGDRSRQLTRTGGLQDPCPREPGLCTLLCVEFGPNC